MGAVAGHCSDSPWVPSCAAGMSPYIYIHVTNLGACWGTQFPTDLLKDPFLSSVCVCVCASCVWARCVCVSKLCVSKLCVNKLCVSKLCVNKLCVSKLCVSKLCVSKLCASKL